MESRIWKKGFEQICTCIGDYGTFSKKDETHEWDVCKYCGLPTHRIPRLIHTKPESFNLGDIVWCTESGVRGEVIRFYTPTACEPQVMVLTDDGGYKYHAPLRTWRKYIPYANMAEASKDVSLEAHTQTTTDQDIINKHGEYVLGFATNHGLSIAEAHEAPMVQAHLDFLMKLSEQEKNGFLRSATD